MPDEFIADAEPGEHDGTILIRTMDGATNTYTVSYDSMTRTFKVKASAGSTSIFPASSVIESRLPNPIDHDDALEEVTLRNAGDDIVLLDVAQVERDRFEYASSTEGTVIVR